MSEKVGILTRNGYIPIIERKLAFRASSGTKVGTITRVLDTVLVKIDFSYDFTGGDLYILNEDETDVATFEDIKLFYPKDFDDSSWENVLSEFSIINGSTSSENVKIQASFYGGYHIRVVCTSDDYDCEFNEGGVFFFYYEAENKGG